jgi:hypothetical protein
MNLALAEDVTKQTLQRDAPPGWRAGPPSGKIAIVETGVALCRENEWGQQASGYPELWYQPRRNPSAVPKPGHGSCSRSRYDAAYRHHSEVSG